ncbi:MAG TPA: phosphorylase [Gammaproteobacteria bacterium]|nr:phosphorylase [Gammaproteobacteria bacterium]
MRSSTGYPVWCSSLAASQNAVVVGLELEASLLRRTAATHGPRIYVSGPGGDRARAASREAIEAGAQALIAFGLAGGLVPAATPGTLVLPVSIRSEAGEWRVDVPWHDRLTRVLAPRHRVIEGAIFSSPEVVTTRDAKAALAARTGAVAVDMESAAIASAAAEAGLPFVAVRAIADGPEDALPDNVAALVTLDGRTRYSGLLGYLAAPRRLRLLIQLARRSRRARSELERVARVLLQCGR